MVMQERFESAVREFTQILKDKDDKIIKRLQKIPKIEVESVSFVKSKNGMKDGVFRVLT